MFRKILIANRGEIACRIVKTAQRMGIATVAVYSDADANARHVRLADEAVRIGPAPAQESYLNASSILLAAQQTGAGAIHPGYGFLSENAGFAEACAAANIVFIGPPASAIRAMGHKSAAKALMGRAGVPLAPGYHGDDQRPAFLAGQAALIGYPVLIKASAGGGGKGMRRVDAPARFAAALEACCREARSAFGNDHMLIESYILRPRHIEIQIFADAFGACVHLFERDCSVQRRHQKVLEEAPAPGLPQARRAEMAEAAVTAAKAVGYQGAGTVEFIAGPGGSFYFMEMNTRLQVEHRVTEMITGLDLVEWQLRVANGERLPLSQDDLHMVGHAIEARIYAEDPDAGFLPSTGRLKHMSMPPESGDLRIDAAVEQGDTITPFYDPMIAKLIAHGPDRNTALARLSAALAQVHIAGIKSNVEFLGRLLVSPSFANADLDTALIEREAAHLFASASETPSEVWLLAALAELLAETAKDERYQASDRSSPWRARGSWRLNTTGRRWMEMRRGDTHAALSILTSLDSWEVTLDQLTHQVRGDLRTSGELRAQLGERQLAARVIAEGDLRHVFFEGRHFVLTVGAQSERADQTDAPAGGLRSPMPGRVLSLLVAPGAAVEKGTPLLVMEAMKMEHTLAAPVKGTLKSYRCAPGDQVAEGVELIEFEAAP